MKFPHFILCTSIAITSCAQAESAPFEAIRLVCTYTHSLSQGKSEATSGTELFVIKHSPDGIAIIDKQNSPSFFIGSISTEEIRGEAETEIKGRVLREMVVINRYTGNLVSTFGVEGEDGLVHFGKCSQAGERLF